MLRAQTNKTGRSEIIRELQRGDNKSALSLARGALKAAPHDCTLLSLEALAFSGLRDTQQALQSFRNALAACPNYLPALEGAAQIEFADHQPEAGPLLSKILVIQPTNATAHAMLASTLREQGKCGEALNHYAASRTLFSSQPNLTQGYGACLTATGDLQSALAIYQQLLLSNPSDEIRYDVALLQWKTHANTDALATLAPLLTGVKQVPALALASKMHEENGETPEAVDLLRRAILQSPEEVDNYLDFATIAYNHTSFQVGVDMLDAGLRRIPNSAPLLVARGVLEVQLSHSEAAIADFEAAHKLDPKLSFATDAIGILHSQLHQNTEALALFESQAKLHPDDPLLQYLVAEQLAEDGARDAPTHLDAAIAAAKRAATLDPRYQAAHDLLAVLYVRSNQPELAILEAEAALALDPNDQNALFQEILARRRLGKGAEIKALTERINEARAANELHRQKVDRYSLKEQSK